MPARGKMKIAKCDDNTRNYSPDKFTQPFGMLEHPCPAVLPGVRMREAQHHQYFCELGQEPSTKSRIADLTSALESRTSLFFERKGGGYYYRRMLLHCMVICSTAARNGLGMLNLSKVYSAFPLLPLLRRGAAPGSPRPLCIHESKRHRKGTAAPDKLTQPFGACSSPCKVKHARGSHTEQEKGNKTESEGDRQLLASPPCEGERRR